MKKEKMFIRSISVRRCGGYSGTRLGISILFQKERFPDSNYQPNLILSPGIDGSHTAPLDEIKFIEILNRLTSIYSVLENFKDKEVECLFYDKKLVSFTIGKETFTNDGI